MALRLLGGLLFMSRLSLIIDPGGIAGVRTGINLRVYPAGESVAQFQEVGTPSERLANSGLSSGGFEDRYEFTTSFYLEGAEWIKFKSLLNWNKNRRLNGQPWETVIYNLVEPFSEIRATRSRMIVPSTAVISTTDVGNGLFEYVYWIAIQGAISANYVQVGRMFKVDMVFQEGTFLSAS